MEVKAMIELWCSILIVLTVTSRTTGVERPPTEVVTHQLICLPGRPICLFKRKKRPFAFGGQILFECPHSSHQCSMYYDCPEVIKLLRDDNDTIVKHGQRHYCGHWEPYGPLVCCHNREAEPLPSHSADFPTLPVGECGHNNMHLLSEKIYRYVDTEVADTTDCLHFRRRGKRDTSYQECLRRKGNGRRKLTSTREKRLIGGRPARMGQWPWLAAILFTYFPAPGQEIIGGSPTALGCVGSIINKRYILTSSYCIFQRHKVYSLRPVSVVVGDYELANSTDRDKVNQELLNDILFTLDIKPQTIGVEFTIPHELFDEYYYSRNAFKNDIGLLRLVKDIEFNDFTQPICLPTSEAPAEVKGNLTGEFTVSSYSFHSLVSASSLPRTLHLPSLSVEECEKVYSKYFGEMVKLEHDKIFCAGGNLNEGLCDIDQGAPLMRSAPDGRMFLVGVAAEAGLEGCDVLNRPGMFTRTEPYMPWIIKELRP